MPLEFTYLLLVILAGLLSEGAIVPSVTVGLGATSKTHHYLFYCQFKILLTLCFIFIGLGSLVGWSRSSSLTKPMCPSQVLTVVLIHLIPIIGICQRHLSINLTLLHPLLCVSSLICADDLIQ